MASLACTHHRDCCCFNWVWFRQYLITSKYFTWPNAILPQDLIILTAWLLIHTLCTTSIYMYICSYVQIKINTLAGREGIETQASWFRLSYSAGLFEVLTDPPCDSGCNWNRPKGKRFVCLCMCVGAPHRAHPRKVQLPSKFIFILISTYSIVEWARDNRLAFVFILKMEYMTLLEKIVKVTNGSHLYRSCVPIPRAALLPISNMFFQRHTMQTSASSRLHFWHTWWQTKNIAVQLAFFHLIVYRHCHFILIYKEWATSFSWLDCSLFSQSSLGGLDYF